jgi:hypothetical protein
MALLADRAKIKSNQWSCEDRGREGRGRVKRVFGVSAGPVKNFYYHKDHKTRVLLPRSMHRINFRQDEYLLGKQAFARVPTWNLLLIIPSKGTL